MRDLAVDRIPEPDPDARSNPGWLLGSRGARGARHYADELRVPQSALSRALTHVTGRPTKELITDRRMLEAARLLRFTDLTIGEVAYRAGFADSCTSHARSNAAPERPRRPGHAGRPREQLRQRHHDPGLITPRPA